MKTKSEKVVELGLVREDGFLYYIDKDGDVSRMKLPGKTTKERNEQD